MDEKTKEAYDVEAEEAAEAAAEPAPEEKAEQKETKKSDKKSKARIKELEEALAKAEAKALEAEDKYLRLAAEYDNFRKRSKSEREAIYTEASADAIKELLPVFDNLNRATEYTAPD